MNYGNANDLIQKCPQCTESIDKHRISLIRSSDKTDALVRKLQDYLTKVNISAILKGLELDRTSTMAGAAIVRFNTSAQPRQYVTVSGPGVLLLKHIASMGKDVTIVDMANALVGQNKVHNIKKATIKPNTEKGIEYPWAVARPRNC